MKIAIATDHAGFKYKQILKEYLKNKNIDIIDSGPDSEARSDYADFGSLVAKLVASHSVDFGVLICGSGIGMCMIANRFKGVRAAVIRNEEDVVLSRKHNNANVACFGSRITSIEDIKVLLDVFFNTEFEKGRHIERVNKLDNLS